MKEYAASVFRRGRSSPKGPISLAFLQRAQKLAIRRAARDAHRAACNRDAEECAACQEHARGIAEAKRVLNDGPS